MNNPSDELITIGKKIGSRAPLWIQGGGGNISEKVNGLLCIKASGARLDQMDEPCCHALVSLDSVLNLNHLLTLASSGESVEKRYSDWISSSSHNGKTLGRASMECGFHLVLQKKFVIHFHSLASILLCHELKKDQTLLEEINQEGLEICVLGNEIPGFKLTELIKRSKTSDSYLLENHGVILHSGSEDIVNAWDRLETRFLMLKYPKLLEIYHLPEIEVFNRLGSLKSSFKIYFPDTAVYYSELMDFLNPTSDGEFEVLEPQKKIINYIQTKNWKLLNLLEIWAATVVLAQVCPDLPEVPLEIASRVASLPTEEFRRARQN